ncbi:MAG: hypothetical protein GY852_08895 [bacterium]|nr:hypothetical protein [bacterium]
MASRQLQKAKGFSKIGKGYGFRGPLLDKHTPRITVEQAAKEMDVGVEVLMGVFSSRRKTGNFQQYGKRGTSILLAFDFSRKEVVMEGGLSTIARLALPDVETLKRYLELREQIRGRKLIAVSEALRSRNPEPVTRMRKFIGSHILLPPEAEVPKVVFSSKEPKFRATVRKLNKIIYCEPRHGDGLVFASTLLEGTEHMRNRLLKKTKRELDSFSSPEGIPFEFGMKLLIIEMIYAQEIPELFLQLRPFSFDPLVMSFLSASRGEYLEFIPPPPARY